MLVLETFGTTTVNQTLHLRNEGSHCPKMAPQKVPQVHEQKVRVWKPQLLTPHPVLMVLPDSCSFHRPGILALANEVICSFLHVFNIHVMSSLMCKQSILQQKEKEEESEIDFTESGTLSGCSGESLPCSPPSPESFPHHSHWLLSFPLLLPTLFHTQGHRSVTREGCRMPMRSENMAKGPSECRQGFGAGNIRVLAVWNIEEG